MAIKLELDKLEYKEDVSVTLRDENGEVEEVVTFSVELNHAEIDEVVELYLGMNNMNLNAIKDATDMATLQPVYNILLKSQEILFRNAPEGFAKRIGRLQSLNLVGLINEDLEGFFAKRL